jgi:hypothetical protein
LNDVRFGEGQQACRAHGLGFAHAKDGKTMLDAACPELFPAESDLGAAKDKNVVAWREEAVAGWWDRERRNKGMCLLSSRVEGCR